MTSSPPAPRGGGRRLRPRAVRYPFFCPLSRQAYLHCRLPECAEARGCYHHPPPNEAWRREQARERARRGGTAIDRLLDRALQRIRGTQ